MALKATTRSGNGVMVPPFTELRTEDPQQFYLGSSGLDELADGRIKHGKTVLPIPSQILAAQSSVLRDLFRSLRTPDTSAAQAGLIELETPFKDFALEEVVYFLRFVYHITDATAASLKLAAEHAHGVIRLAHSLDVSGPFLGAADEYVGSEMTGVAAALKWLPLTETYNLKSAWSLGIRVLAVEMSTGNGDSRAHHVAVRKLSKTINFDSFVAVMAAVAAACRKSSTLSQREVPAANVLERWQAADLQPDDGEYTYVVTEFTKQQSVIQSPEFEAAGYMWRLQVELQGDKVGLFLKASAPMWFPVMYTLQLIDQLTGEVHSKFTERHTFTDTYGWGYKEFIELSVLRSTPGYIVNDAVKFRVRIAVDEECSL